ncbi:hypothetical protein [Microbispora hainanensis]|uniref:Uncharacterized protein n=2 Tax=Microbispora TaxID=2005 RepID=A0A544YVI9_9ACTN|nr:hypothetical protein [Microbispora hainanensis]TQS20781.1 hypothetical protein FLX08_15045 [Microbispora hainanensis]
MLKRLPGGEVHNLVSTTPDTAVVFKPAVVQTPAILTILVFLGRLVAGLVRTLVVHPIAVAVIAIPGVIWVRYGWPTAVAAVSIPLSLLFGWMLADQASFARFIGWRLLAFWRRFWIYRRHWQPVMIVSGLGRHLQGHSADGRRVRQSKRGRMNGLAHFLDGLRCSICGALNVLWLDPIRGLVECHECGQTALTIPETAEEDS